MKNIVLKWGAIGGLANIIIGGIYFIADFTPGTFATIITLSIFVAVVIFGAFEYRDKQMNGFTSFSELFKIGFFIAMIIGVVSSFWALLYPIVIDPNNVDTTLKQYEMQLEEQGLPEEQIKEAISQNKFLMKPHVVFALQLVWHIGFGAFISLIAASILKREKPQATLDS